MATSSALPGFNAPAVGFEQPFAMLEACHERVQRTLTLLQRLRAHVREHGADVPAQQAARDVLRYFDIAALTRTGPADPAGQTECRHHARHP